MSKRDLLVGRKRDLLVGAHLLDQILAQGAPDAAVTQLLDEKRTTNEQKRPITHLLDQILAQGAADAAVAQLHHLLLSFGDGDVCPNQSGIDVDVGQVVDYERHPFVLLVRENVP